MYVIKIYIDDGFLSLLFAGRKIQKIRVDTGLLFDIVGEQVILCFKMVVKAAVGNFGLLAYIFNR